MKKITLYILLIFVVLNGSAQTYPFDSIPDNLKRRANAVVRSEQCQYTIVKQGSALEKVKVVVTLINENAGFYRDVAVLYDKFSRINYLKGAIYDEKGETVKVLGILDVTDMSAITGGSFYSDDRMKYLYFPKHKYPYTIEYEYEKEYSGDLNYPFWHFQERPDVSVQRSGIQFVVPNEMKLRYHAKNLKNGVDSVITAGTKIYTWQEEDIPATVSRNYYSLRAEDINPVLFTAPLDFDFGGFKGSMSSWKTFGEWNYNLINGLDVLPQSELAKVSEIVSRTDDPRERAKLIYEYVQSKTRYVSIQVGIGGYRPAEASAVAKNGFGDCKALVNFTKALLKAAGITSYYTVVKSGEDKGIISSFVANQFDHIILCVPMKSDTVWLECTDPLLPFNYLGTFTDDRDALLITPEGGKMVRTPEFKKSENIFKRTGSVTISVSGGSVFEISDSYSGYTYYKATQAFRLKSEDELKRYLYSDLRFFDFDVSSVSYSEHKSEKPTASFKYGISVKDFTVASGKRIYFNPSIDQSEYLGDDPSPSEISKSEIHTDSISFNLPTGYKVEFLPPDVMIESAYGKFRYQLDAKSDRIVYTRYLEINKSKVPAEKFYDLRNFVNAIAKADLGNIILKN